MNKLALPLAATACVLVGAIVNFYWDPNTALFCGVIAGFVTHFYCGDASPRDARLKKRIYALELVPLVEAINQSITSGFYGESQWMLHESSNLARGYLKFTIRWTETWTAEATPNRQVQKMGHLEVKLDDVSEGIGKPKTSALFLFQDNSALSDSHFNHIVQKTVQRLDFFISEHQKVELSSQELDATLIT